MVSGSVIPAAAQRHNLIALGKTRSGKSSKLRVFAEGLLDAEAPVCILDPKGDWWGLKSSADGKRAGYPIVIFGGEHADVPINEHSGAHVAEIIATGNRPALIDLGGWMVGSRTRFFVDFASTFFRLARGARHLIIDEVHNFAPQGRIMDPDAGKMLHWANRLASEGSGKGITLYAASQRPQKVHKDFVTSCETLVACKVIHKLDRDAIKDWIDGCADATKGREVIADLAQLKKPEAWVWCPEVDFGPQRMTFPMFRTYDSFKPQPADVGKLKGWAEVDLDEVKAKLVSVVKEAEANDPRKLKARIAELERGASIKHPNLVENTAMRTALTEAQQRIATLERDNAELEQNRDTALASLERVKSMVGAALASAVVPTYQKVTPPAPRTVVARRPPPPAPRARAATNGHAHSDVSIGKGERACLTAIAQYDEGVDREQITILTGYKRSTRDAYVQRLQAAGLVDIGPPIRVTSEGLSALPSDFEPLPTGDALRAHWLRRLPAGEAAVFQLLVDSYPRAVSRDEITNLTEYKRSTRDAYIQRLGTRKLVVARSGEVVAADMLFDGV